ncbi:putative c2h2 zinc finger protein [Diaporthe ampelina]|uniref:Putative c2h2 zinc finger protein n=1 Tax=Diaporthe ampelina TaxID=1214573 RepID=A0A0G2FNG4_9PEZI|nr:putative c2h2 zinc finger protein [Diaporthe ampelina]
MENLENMMLAEAIRLSLAAEEDRKRKAEKEEKKDAKRKEKEERKAAKAAAKGHPYSGSGQSSTNGRSYQNQSYLQEDPRASGVSLAGKSDASDEGGAGRSGENEHDDTTSTEPMFNYRSLAQMVGVEMDGINAGRRLSQIGESHAEDESSVVNPGEDRGDDKRDSIHEASAEHAEDVSAIPKAEDDDNDKMSKSVATLTQEMMNARHGGAQDLDGAAATQSSGPVNTPQLMVTPETPVPEDDDEAESKQLGFQGTRTVEIPGEMTQ